MRKAHFMATVCSATMCSAAVCSAALMLLAAACGTDRSVSGSTVRFACTSSLDCVTGYSCLCGYCQPAGGALQCLADAIAGDTGATVTDAGSAPCNVATWAGCKPDEGCYWDDGQKRQKKAVCLSYGTGALNSTCDAGQLNACGKDPIAGPLLCDSLDKKCYPLCDTSRATPCATGETCFSLQDADKRAWPNHAGICAK